MTTLAKARELSNRTKRGRAINSIAEFLRSSLSVPNIYIEPRIQGHLDLLAVDRGGGGDLHGVEIIGLELRLPAPSSSPELIAILSSQVDRMKLNPTHYRYLAMPKILLRLLPKLQLFSPDGIGRTGILLVSQQNDDLPFVEIAIKPERYRVSASAMKQIDRFLSRNRPDIEVRI